MDLLDLFVKVGYDDSDVESGIAGTSKKGKGFASTLSKGFGTVATAVGVVATGITALATAGVKYNATMEQYQVSFATMLGSAEAGVALTEKLKEKAASTPFEMTDLANVTQLLLNYGVTSDEVIDKMGMLGDISQGNADKLNSVALAYGQMSSLGKVTLQDVKQMIGAGFNPLQEISERTGESMESLYDRISDGTLAVDEITESMQYATSEGGKYFNAMENQSKTFNGLMSTLKDNAMSALGSITSGLSDIATQNILPTLIGYVDELSTAFEEGGFEGLFDTFGSILGDIVAQVSSAAPDIITGAITLLSSFVNSIIANLPTIIPAAIQVIMALVNGILVNLPLLLQAAIDILVALATGIGAQLPTLIPAIVQTMIFLVQTLIANMPLLVDAAIQLITGLANGLLASIPLLVEAVPELILSLVDAIVTNLPTILESGVSIILAIVQGLIEAIPDLIAAIPEIMMAIVQAFADLAPDIQQAGADLISGLWEGIKGMGSWLWEQITDFAKSVVDTFKGALGIASPSKVLADQVGKFMALGIGEGITDNIGAIKNAVASTVDAVSGMDINTSARVTGSTAGISAMPMASGSTLGAMTFNFYDKVKTPYQTGRVINDTIQEALYGYGS